MRRKSVTFFITLIVLVLLTSIPVYADTVVQAGSTYELHPDAKENQYEISGITGNFESDDLLVNLDWGDIGTFLDPEYMQGCYIAKAPVLVRSLDEGYVFGVYKLEYYTNKKNLLKTKQATIVCVQNPAISTIVSTLANQLTSIDGLKNIYLHLNLTIA